MDQRMIVRQVVTVFIIVVISATAHSPSLQNGWTTWDDDVYVLDNPDIRSFSGENVRKIWTSAYNGSYLPVTMMSYMADYAVGEFDPFVYHRTNFILHLCNIVLVYCFIVIFSGSPWIAAVTALLFGIHPMHVESVAWISGRKDLLAMFFFLPSSICYIFYRRTERRRWLAGSFFFFLLSLLSKVIVISFPLILLAFDLYEQRKWTPRVLKEKIPFFIAAAVFAAIGFIGQDSVGAVKPVNKLIHNIIVSLHGIVFYVEKLVLPFRLSNMYPYPASLTFSFYLYAAAAVTAIVLLWRTVNDRRVLFGILFFLISLLPVLQFIRFSHIFAADRFTYISYLGLFYLIGVAAEFIHQKIGMKGLLTAAVIITAGFSFITWERTHVWKDSPTLWKDMLRKYPDALKGL